MGNLAQLLKHVIFKDEVFLGRTFNKNTYLHRKGVQIVAYDKHTGQRRHIFKGKSYRNSPCYQIAVFAEHYQHGMNKADSAIFLDAQQGAKALAEKWNSGNFAGYEKKFIADPRVRADRLRDVVTQLMDVAGSCYAVTAEKYICTNANCCDPIYGKQKYHIHPDASYPHQTNIETAETLRDLEELLRTNIDLLTIICA